MFGRLRAARALASSSRVALASAAAGVGTASAFALGADPNKLKAVVTTLDGPPENPLLAGGLPRYADVRACHVSPAMDMRLASAERELEALESAVEAALARGETPSYAVLADGSERISEMVSAPWSTVKHLKSVKDSAALRTAVEDVQPRVVAAFTRMGQSRALYRGWKALQQDAAAWSALTPTQRRVAELEIRDAELSGVGLEGAQKERFNAVVKELAALSTTFANNVLDATKAFAHELTTRDQVAGLPPSALAMMAANARARGSSSASAADGPWVVTLDAPCMLSVMKHADDAALRERVYRAYVTRASELSGGGKGDNAPNIERILALRREKAALLGYASFAEVSLAKKSAALPDAWGLLSDLREISAPAAAAEHTALEAYAGRKLSHWDVNYYAEKLKRERYAYDEEETRQYLPLDAVLGGLFGVVSDLFGVSIKQIDPETIGAQIWHESVRLFEVRRGDELAGHFYLDPYARPAEKKGGAWMNGAVGRSRALASKEEGGSVRLPVAILCCNQSPPVVDADGKVTPSLMTFDNVTTLFHETGHGLQHLLTTVDEGAVAGISGVEWDAVEQPSQFMEYWVEQRDVLSGMAKHWQTGEQMPDELVAKIRAAKTYRAASAMVRQLEFAMTDLALHDEAFTPGGKLSIFDAHKQVAATTSPLPYLPENRFLCAFSHIFAGGYAAGYYSYKWAEVLSADGFAAFEEAGLEDKRSVASLGRKYAETVLAMGGSRPASDVFKLFRGRAPSADALLRHNDLLPSKRAAGMSKL